ncbi:MAG: hypothetical protein ACRBFS_12990 [Aureispira sp.]
MADSKSLISMAQQFSGLPMQGLIGAPLMAAPEANNAMAITQTHFILATCPAPPTTSTTKIPLKKTTLSPKTITLKMSPKVTKGLPIVRMDAISPYGR